MNNRNSGMQDVNSLENKKAKGRLAARKFRFRIDNKLTKIVLSRLTGTAKTQMQPEFKRIQP
jgi:hypothetical protein